MSWAEVKKINSDMSLPLDKLIKGNKRLAASDAVLAVIVSEEKSISQSSKILGYFTPKVSGNIRLLANLKVANSDYRVYVTLSKPDGTKVGEVFTSNSTYTEVFNDINIEANLQYKITLRCPNYTGRTDMVKILGQVIDGGTFEYSVV